MKLNILNHNPTIEYDEKLLDELYNICDYIKQNISSHKYLIYHELLNKVMNYVTLFGQKYDDEFKNAEKTPDYFDSHDSDIDENVSVSSISEYAVDDEDESEEYMLREQKKIENFETESKLRLDKYIERFNA